MINLHFRKPSTNMMAKSHPLFVKFLLISVFLSNNLYALPTIFIEDWDTTPAVPDELRGWRNSGNGLGQLGHDGVNGFFFRTIEFSNPILFVGTSSSPDFSTWLNNDYVGNKDYRRLGVSRIAFDAIHNDIPGVTQSPSPRLSLLFAAAELVPDPNNPGVEAIPFIWTISDEGLDLNGGWQQLEFDIPFEETSPPDGWFVYPESDANWNLVMQQVDDIRICFCPFQIGLGGLLLSWDVGVDNFTVITGNVLEAQPVPGLNRFGIYASILLIGVLAIGWIKSNRLNLRT